MRSGGRLRQAFRGPRRGVIVEFTGAPGSGKSTLARHVLARARERGIAALEARAVLPVYLATGPMAWIVRHLLPFTWFDHRRLRFHQQIEYPLLLPRFAGRHPRGWRLFRAEARADPRRDPRGARPRTALGGAGDPPARDGARPLLAARPGSVRRGNRPSQRPALRALAARARPGSAAPLPPLLGLSGRPRARAGQPRALRRAHPLAGVPKRLEGEGDAELREFVRACATVSAGVSRTRRGGGASRLSRSRASTRARGGLGSPQCAALVEDLLEAFESSTRRRA